MVKWAANRDMKQIPKQTHKKQIQEKNAAIAKNRSKNHAATTNKMLKSQKENFSNSKKICNSLHKT